ncbi:MAG: hypothetical protein V3W05_09885 [candidate division NC10 bacterium]
MKLWGEYSITSPALQGGISSSLAEWLRDKLKRLPPSTMILETNVGGLDEAGTYSPDFDWAGMVATEFPEQRVQVHYLPPQGRDEAKTPYFARLEISGQEPLRAEVHGTGPGAWAIYEDSAA